MQESNLNIKFFGSKNQIFNQINEVIKKTENQLPPQNFQTPPPPPDNQ